MPAAVEIMTPFQEYAHNRWRHGFPEWEHLREDLNLSGEPFDSNVDSGLEVRYVIPSPANPDNCLYVVFAPDEIIVKFAVQGSHEHYDPDIYGMDDDEITELDRWNESYNDAMNEYVYPVLNDQLVVVMSGVDSWLVSDVARFLELNQMQQRETESWSKSRVEFRLDAVN